MAIARDIAYGLTAAATAPLWGTALLCTGKWRTDWPGRFGRGPALPAARGPRLLIHGVSVGEINAIRLLTETLLTRNPGLELVIAATTNTGFARAQALYGSQHPVVRYPVDLSGAVNRFLERIRPDVVASVELELWPNFVEACRKRRIPLCVVNGRLSDRSFHRYARIRPLVRSTFAAVTEAGVQTTDYARRFMTLGTPADRVHVLDSMKWDTAAIAEAASVPGAAELAQAMGIDLHKPLVVAGSTGPGEEAFLAASKPPGVQLLVAPRKPERFSEVAAVLPDCVRRSEGRSAPSEFFLLDTLGELRQAYALADVVMVGRSFLGLYGSDLFEPIALGKPTIIGPHHRDFQHAVDAFLAGGGVRISTNPWQDALEFLAAPADAARLAERGQAVIRAHQGSTARHAAMLERYLQPAGENANAGAAPNAKSSAPRANSAPPEPA